MTSNCVLSAIQMLNSDLESLNINHFAATGAIRVLDVDGDPHDLTMAYLSIERFVL